MGSDSSIPRGFTLERPDRLADTPGTGALRLGSASVDLTPALGLDTAGFGFVSSRHAQAVFGRLRASLLLIEGEDGSRVLLISTDLLAGTRFLTEALAQRLGPELGLGIDRIWLCASHTHSGPGHLFGERFYDCLAARTNDFDLDLARWMVDRLVRGAHRAAESLEPGRIGWGSAPMWGMVWQRSLLATLANYGEPSWMGDKKRREQMRALAERLNGEAPPSELAPDRAAADSRVQVLWAEQLDGRPIAVFGVMHATPAVLPAHMAILSPDAVGVACRRVLHALHGVYGCMPTVGLVGGSMGDTNLIDPSMDVDTFRDVRAPTVSFERREDLIDLTERVGRLVASAVLTACSRARERATSDMPVEVRFEEAHIPGASGPTYALPAEHQVGNAQFGGSELNRPADPMVATWWSLLSAPMVAGLVFRWIVGEPSGRRSKWWYPVPVRLPVWGDDLHSPKNHVLYDVLRTFGRRFYGRNLRAGDAFEPHLPVRHLRLGELELVGLPVEPSAVCTARIREALCPDRPHDVFLLGLCGGYAGYAVTPEEYRVQDYEGAATLWGRQFQPFVQAVAERVASGPARPPGTLEPGQATFDTDPRAAGSPIALEVPARALQPFTGRAEIRLGAYPSGARRLARVPEPPVHRGGGPKGHTGLRELADRVRGDAERLVLWGWWFSEHPEPSERAHPLADGWIVRLEQRLEAEGAWLPVQWGACQVDDRDVSFYLQRTVSADRTRVRWVASVRLPIDLVPEGREVRWRVREEPGIRPLAGSIQVPWRWTTDPSGELREGGPRGGSGR